MTKITPASAVVDDDECTSVPLQIPMLKLMAMERTTPAQQKDNSSLGQR
jgi:hypothetical protein